MPENLKKAIEARRQAKAKASKPAVTEKVTAANRSGRELGRKRLCNAWMDWSLNGCFNETREKVPGNVAV